MTVTRTVRVVVLSARGTESLITLAAVNDRDTSRGLGSRGLEPLRAQQDGCGGSGRDGGQGGDGGGDGYDAVSGCDLRLLRDEADVVTVRCGTKGFAWIFFDFHFEQEFVVQSECLFVHQTLNFLPRNEIRHTFWRTTFPRHFGLVFQNGCTFAPPQQRKRPSEQTECSDVLLLPDDVVVVGRHADAGTCDEVADGCSCDRASSIRTGEIRDVQVFLDPDREVERETGLAEAAATRTDSTELRFRKLLQTQTTE